MRNENKQAKIKQLRWTASKGLSSKDLAGPPLWKKLSTWIWKRFSSLKHKMRTYLTVTEPQAREEGKFPTRMSMTAASHAVRHGKRKKTKVQQVRMLNSSQRWRWAGYATHLRGTDAYRKAFLTTSPWYIHTSKLSIKENALHRWRAACFAVILSTC